MGLNLGRGLGRGWRTLTTGSGSEEEVALDALLLVVDAEWRWRRTTSRSQHSRSLLIIRSWKSSKEWDGQERLGISPVLSNWSKDADVEPFARVCASNNKSMCLSIYPVRKKLAVFLGKMECLQSDLSMSSIRMYNRLLTIATERQSSRSSPGNDGVEETAATLSSTTTGLNKPVVPVVTVWRYLRLTLCLTSHGC
jgi:hypothetical protein